MKPKVKPLRPSPLKGDEFELVPWQIRWERERVLRNAKRHVVRKPIGD